MAGRWVGWSNCRSRLESWLPAVGPLDPGPAGPSPVPWAPDPRSIFRFPMLPLATPSEIRVCGKIVPTWTWEMKLCVGSDSPVPVGIGPEAPGPGPGFCGKVVPTWSLEMEFCVGGDCPVPNGWNWTHV